MPPLAGALSDLALNLLGFELLNYGSLTASNSWYEEASAAYLMV